MSYSYNKNLVKNAQTLRKNMTPEEKHLWYDFLKHLPLTVNRQKNIENFIVDFFIAKNKIAIEIDGIQHEGDSNKEKDIARDAKLEKMGITVLRYSNHSIRYNFNQVCEDILKHLELI
ncbi:MAG: DUF559 domain-containing protein [Clostridia bacterium]|nr:DUF559 domain-containing protein [Clostridia bacterium]